jgi:hypothetical protein
MKNTNFALSFSIQLIVVLSVVLTLHFFYFYAMNLSVNWNAWSIAYVSNCAMTLFATLAIYRFRNTHTESLGYIFLVGSLLKLTVFAAVIQPLLTVHYPEKTDSFFLFFVPYTFALAVEIRVLIRLLNRL